MSLVTTSQALGRVPVTILHVRDRVNLGNVAELEKTAGDAYASGARDVVLDLAASPALTSVALRAILSIYKQLHGDGPPERPDSPRKSIHFKIANASPQVREVLTIAGLADYIDIFDSLPDAVASF
jgi:anti-anti-sigma factor